MDHFTYYFQVIACQSITNHVTDITKQSNNKRLFSESMSSCLAKVFSLHLGNDLYLKDKGEYPGLWRSSFFNSFPLIPLIANSCSFILQNCIIPLWIIQGWPSSPFHRKAWRIPPKVVGVVSLMLANSSTAFDSSSGAILLTGPSKQFSLSLLPVIAQVHQTILPSGFHTEYLKSYNSN